MPLEKDRDITGTERRGLKIRVFKQLQLQERDKLKIDPITKTEWKEYYGKLWNEQGSKGEEGTEEERRSEATDGNEDVTKTEELNKLLKHTKKNRKSCGLNNLPMELWKFGGNALKMHIQELFNKITDKNKMPQEWVTGMVINIHKKGTKSNCENYRGIALLHLAYKLSANIIKNRLNEHLEDEIVEEQCGFRKGRSCTDAIFTVQQVIEKRKEHNLPLFLLLIDYETAYDNINRDKLWEMMDNKIPNYLLITIKCIYRNTKVTIKFNDGISEPIYINKGVRQRCGLSPVLLNIYINKIIQEFKIVIKKGIPLNNRKVVNTIL